MHRFARYKFENFSGGNAPRHPNWGGATALRAFAPRSGPSAPPSFLGRVKPPKY